MKKIQKSVIRLIGGLKLRGTDWDILELRGLFQRVGDTVAKDGVVTRYMRYFGDAKDHTEVRFFGIQVDSITYIPEGMVALELGDNTLTVFKPAPAGTDTILQEPLTWNWLDLSATGAPIGDFSVAVPPDWTSQPGPITLEFVTVTNMYFEKGRPYDEEIRLVEYDPRWPLKFNEMVDWIHQNIFPEIALRIEHF